MQCKLERRIHMTAIYFPDDHYYRLLHFLLREFMGGTLADHRDELVIGLGETAGIWPEYTRPND
jgi:hypothetical protein